MSFYLTILHSQELTSESVRDHGQGPIFVYGINRDRGARLSSANEGWVLYNPANPRNGARSLPTACKDDWEEVFVVKVSNDAVKDDIAKVFQGFDKPMCYRTIVQIIVEDDKKAFPNADPTQAQFNGLGNIFVISDERLSLYTAGFNPEFVGPRDRTIENHVMLFEAIVRTCCEKYGSRYNSL